MVVLNNNKGHAFRNVIGIMVVLMSSASMFTGVASAVSIWDASENPAVPYSWTSSNFEGFNYTETLTLNGNYAATRIIPQNGLVYNTGANPVSFQSFTKEGLTVDSDQSYDVVSWQGEKLVAIRGVTNKLAKLVLEFGQDDMKTLKVGETWVLGAGYNLTLSGIDNRTVPIQIWMTLRKNGTVIDEGIGQAPTFSADPRSVYFKKKTILNESDALLFTVCINNVSLSPTSDMVQFKYAWLIDETTAKEIHSDDQYGVFMVRALNPKIEMDNENTISLTKNTEATLMGNLKFVIENSDTLRFYPEFNVTAPIKDYDADHDGHISKSEALAAVSDYFSGGCTKQQALFVVGLYFNG